MGLLSIYSTNPKLSWILQKNPETIRNSKKPYEKKIRKGMAYGFFAKEDHEFVLWFKDNPSETSFSRDAHKGDFEYLDTTRYASPYMIIMLISDCLATASKKIDPEDVSGKFETTVKSTLRVPNIKFIESMAKHYEGKAKIESRQVAESYYEISVTCDTVYFALNLMMTLCFLLAMKDDNTYIPLKQHEVFKYIGVLNAAQAPYFVRYIFGLNAFTEPDTFKKFLNQFQGEGMVMNFGNTQKHRFAAVSKALKEAGKSNILIDIGCGELFNAIRLCGRYKEIYAFEKDEYEYIGSQRKIENRHIENINLVHAEVTPEYVKENGEYFEGAHIIMTEVVEHMPLKDALHVVQAILTQEFDTLILTTPNRDFNVNYGLGEELRHDDHKWEMSGENLEDSFVKPILESLKRKHDISHVGYEIKPIGDSVNGISSTMMVVFTNLLVKQEKDQKDDVDNEGEDSVSEIPFEEESSSVA